MCRELCLSNCVSCCVFLDWWMMMVNVIMVRCVGICSGVIIIVLIVVVVG